MLFYFLLGILSLVLFSQITRSAKQDGLFGYHSIFIFSVVLVFASLSYQSFQQFQAWSGNEISKYLLPPYQSVDYFIFYCFFRFFAPHLISLSAALAFLFAAKFLNKKYQERFFEPEEFWLGALGFFLVGHPGWLFYIVFLIIISFLTHFYSLFIISDSARRISLYYWWIPAGIFVILIQDWLTKLPLWSILKI